jgi:bis(5'-nucleosyl)-tetraphosphatase (symmetrical)
MSTYAIGDVQGCFDDLQNLLQKINFNKNYDTLWFVGDLVNRGPDSLACLRFIKSLKDGAVVVLGNHDLHLISVAHGYQALANGDTLIDILQADDRDELIEWLCQQPLLHHDSKLGFTMVHAGIAPQWNLSTAQTCAKQIEKILQSDQRHELLKHMYGNHPTCWHDDLQGIDRWRCIINFFTRMRFLNSAGCLEFGAKNHPDNNIHLLPWFEFKNRAMKKQNIIFGHWAAIRGLTNTPNVFALDTGCVWGDCLTALNLESLELFSVAAIAKH